MDKLGQRIVEDRAEIARKREEARKLQWQSNRLEREASEMERLLELARLSA
jgi:hypothetical protein